MVLIVCGAAIGSGYLWGSKTQASKLENELNSGRIALIEITKELERDRVIIGDLTRKLEETERINTILSGGLEEIARLNNLVGIGIEDGVREIRKALGIVRELETGN